MYTRSTSAMYQFYKSLTGFYYTPQNLIRTGTRTGEKVEDYKSKIALGQQAGSPYTRNDSKYVGMEAGHLEQHLDPSNLTNPLLNSVFTGFEQIPAHSPVTTSLVKSNALALAGIYRKIRQEQERLNSLASLAEFGDVIRQFGAPFAAIIDLTNKRLNRLQLESRGLKGTVQFRKVKWAGIVASSYLEYAFGLAPLISDTAKVAEAVARWNVESEINLSRSKVSSRGLDTASYDASIKARLIPWSKMYVDIDRITTQESRTQYTVGLASTPVAAFGSNDRLLQLCGFTPRNFITAAWEVVPWSWLLDYFTNVSDILDASVTNTTGVRWIVRTDTVRTVTNADTKFLEAKSKAYAAGYGYPLARFVGEHAGKSSLVSTSMTRTLPVSLGVPALTLSLPSELKQYANMAAVLMSRRPTASSLWIS